MSLPVVEQGVRRAGEKREKKKPGPRKDKAVDNAGTARVTSIEVAQTRTSTAQPRVKPSVSCPLRRHRTSASISFSRLNLPANHLQGNKILLRPTPHGAKRNIKKTPRLSSPLVPFPCTAFRFSPGKHCTPTNKQASKNHVLLELRRYLRLLFEFYLVSSSTASSVFPMSVSAHPRLTAA